MKYNNCILLGVVVLLALGLAMSTGCAKKESEEQAEKQFLVSFLKPNRSMSRM